MSMEKEALTNTIESDLAKRNRNWDKVAAHLAENTAQGNPHGVGDLSTLVNTKTLTHKENQVLVDFNTVITTGIYFNGGGGINSPTSNYGILLVFGNAFIVQFWISSGNGFYTRISADNGANWTAWSEK